MGLDNLPCDEKPQSGPIGLLAHKRLEKPFRGLRGWAGTGVLDAHHGMVSVTPIQLDDRPWAERPRAVWLPPGR